MPSKYFYQRGLNEDQFGALMDQIDEQYEDACEYGAEDDLEAISLDRTVAGRGGWSYKQFSDGRVQIVGAPRGYRAGRMLDPTNPDDAGVIRAIETEIGTWSESASMDKGPEMDRRMAVAAPSNVRANASVASSTRPERRGFFSRFGAAGGVRTDASGFMLTKDGKRTRSRVVSGAGGYIYRQEPDESVMILEGPTGVGSKLRSGTAHRAIVEDIGTYASWIRMNDSEKQAIARRALRGTHRPQISEQEIDSALAKNYEAQDEAKALIRDRIAYTQSLGEQTIAQSKRGQNQDEDEDWSLVAALDDIGDAVLGQVFGAGDMEDAFGGAFERAQRQRERIENKLDRKRDRAASTRDAALVKAAMLKAQGRDHRATRAEHRAERASDRLRGLGGQESNRVGQMELAHSGIRRGRDGNPIRTRDDYGRDRREDVLEHKKKAEKARIRAEHQRKMARSQSLLTPGQAISHKATQIYYNQRAKAQERRAERDQLRYERDRALAAYGAMPTLRSRLPSERFAVQARKAVAEIVQWLDRRGVEARPLSEGTEVEILALPMDLVAIEDKLVKIANKHDLLIQSGQSTSDQYGPYTLYFELANAEYPA